MTEFLKNVWIKMFGTTEWLGVNIGFWISMLAVAILVAVMVVVFWSIKPKKRAGEAAATEEPVASADEQELSEQ